MISFFVLVADWYYLFLRLDLWTDHVLTSWNNEGFLLVSFLYGDLTVVLQKTVDGTFSKSYGIFFANSSFFFLMHQGTFMNTCSHDYNPILSSAA